MSMDMKNISIDFANKLYSMGRESIPSYALEKSRECLLDYISVAFAGSSNAAQRDQKFLAENGFTGNCHIFGMNQTADMRTAAMLNAYRAHVLELDDSHRKAMTHLGAPIFSALLAAAEQYHHSVNEVICAAVVGYEAAIRLGSAIQPGHKKRGFHVTGTCCTVGSAIATATLLQYTEVEFHNVLSASVTSAAGLLAVISGNSEQKPYNASNAAMTGLNAALYGRYLRGAEDILGDDRGFFHAVTDGVDPDKLWSPDFAITTIYQKLYAACRHCHAPIEAMLKLRKEVKISQEQIDEIIVQTYDLAIRGHDHTSVTGIASAQQSIPFCTALAYLYGDCGLSGFSIDRVHDQSLRSLAEKVRVIEDPDMSALVPEIRPAQVMIVCKDGARYTRRVDYAKGEPENPISEMEWAEKYRTLMSFGGIEKNRAEQIREDILKHGHMEASCIFRHAGC